MFELVTVHSVNSFLKKTRSPLLSPNKRQVSSSCVNTIFSLTQIFSGNYDSQTIIQHGQPFSLVRLFSGKEHIFSLNGKITNTLSRKDRASFI